jgi:protein SCO1/2
VTRRLLWFVAAIAGVLIGGVMVWKGYQPPHPAASSSGVADIGGPFTLVDQKGQPFTDKALLGKPSLVFFGFTYCPEVCPTTLTRMSGWLKALGPNADKINIVFISVDPERDTPAKLASYLSAFDPRIRGLTGTQAEVDKVADEYRVYHRKVPLAGGGYTMDHSAAIYVLDPKGSFSSILTYDEPDAKALASLRALIAA